MEVGLFDAVRIGALDFFFDPNQTFIANWDDSYQQPICQHLRINEELGLRDRVISLGGSIREIFTVNEQNVRGQEEVAEAQAAMTIAGASWERLVAWYLNSLGCGLNVVAMNQRAQRFYLPDSFRNAFQVRIGAHIVSSDLDVVLFHWIGEKEEDWMDERYESTNRRHMLRARMHFRNLIDTQPTSFSVCVLSTKTNWNDSIQTPMLWNLIFTHGFRHPLVSVGIEHSSPDEFGYFSYGFVTLPSNSIEGLHADLFHVVRASTMTAGSYWGLPARHDIGMLPIDEVYSQRTNMPTGAQVGNGLWAFTQHPDGIAALRL